MVLCLSDDSCGTNNLRRCRYESCGSVEGSVTAGPFHTQIFM